MELIAELATGHGGDVQLAEDMIAAAADSGAHTVKIQSYTLERLNPRDPQAEWLRQAYLDEAAHVRLMEACARHKVQFLSTPFDIDALTMLSAMGVGRYKIASSEAMRTWWHREKLRLLVSWPWGRLSAERDAAKRGGQRMGIDADLTAIPLYPTPLECVERAVLLDGYSDHTIGTAACKHMISKGAKIIEAHFCVPGRSRQMPWDKTPDQFRELRDWADTVETMTTGVATHFRERWRA